MPEDGASGLRRDHDPLLAALVLPALRLGGALRLVSPQPAVREAMRLTRLSDRFEFAESVEGAARSLR